MLRFAVVGAGGFAAVHIRNIRTLGPELGCELAAVAIRPQDRREGQVEQFQAEGVEVFADAEEMFERLAGRIDAVFIPTGIYTHCPLACAALARGHNVYLEKPPAATVQELDRMLEAVERSGKLCALGFQAISSEEVNRVKRLLVSGELGVPRLLRCWAFWPRKDAYYARNEWAGRLRVDGAWVLDGPTNNALSHQIANMLYWACPDQRGFAVPRAVRAEMYHARDIDSEDTSALEIRTVEGPVLYFIVSHCTAGPQAGPWIEMECTGGEVFWEIGGQAREFDRAGHFTVTRAGTPKGDVLAQRRQPGLGLLRKPPYPPYPLAQLFSRIQVIVPFPWLLVIPPLFGVAAMEADVARGRSSHRYARHQAGERRLIDAAKAEVQFAQKLVCLLMYPPPIAKLYHARQLSNLPPKLPQPHRRILGGLKRPWKLCQQAAEFAGRYKRLESV